jgi:hypothetical protein
MATLVSYFTKVEWSETSIHALIGVVYALIDSVDVAGL